MPSLEWKTDLNHGPVLAVAGRFVTTGGDVAVAAGSRVSLSSDEKTAGYIVKPGDTLKKISGAFGVSLEELLTLNENIKNPDVILPGQAIKIPVTISDKPRED